MRTSISDDYIIRLLESIDENLRLLVDIATRAEQQRINEGKDETRPQFCQHGFTDSCPEGCN